MDLTQKPTTQEWENVSVFISSTFNDMHAERDYLVKNVFPELSEWCEKRHILLSDIDLRWGVTAQDTNMRNTIRKCLNGVDELHNTKLTSIDNGITSPDNEIGCLIKLLLLIPMLAVGQYPHSNYDGRG